MRFAIFSFHLSKVLRLPRKSDAWSYEVLHLPRKIILANQKIWCSKMQPLSGNQRPDLLTSLMNMCFVQRLPREMHLCRYPSNAPRLPSFLEMPQNPHVVHTFGKVQNPLGLPRKTTSEPPHLNLQELSEHVVFLTFWLGHVLRATTACTFSTSQLPRVVWTWCALHILTSKCASRHNSVQFFVISTSKSTPNLMCFVHFDFHMCFAPQRRAIFHLSADQLAPHPPLWRAYFSNLRSHKSFEKHSEWWLFSLFAHLHLLSSDSFSSLIFSLLLFSSSSHLCFSICPYCRKFDFQTSFDEYP